MGTGFRRRTGTNKNVPYLSHEFVIQNHGDIVTCVVMVFILGLMFQVTSPLASIFITPQYNITDPEVTKQPPLYTYGLKDVALVFFYSLAAIIFHAVIQEYVLDKLVRKTRLSKTNTSKFNESGQLVAFYIISLGWLINIFKDEGYFRSLSFFYDGYPHVGMTIWTKLFFIIQMGYWVHVFPELYFQKVKKEEMMQKIVPAVFHLLIIEAIYVLNLQRVGLTLLFIEYLINFIFHFSRLASFFGKSKFSKASFNVYNLVFLVGRLVSIALAVLVFWFGLKSTSVDRINFEERNFNTPLTRYTCLFSIIAIQLYFVWDSFSSFLRKHSEKSSVKKSNGAKKLNQGGKKTKSASSRETSDAELNDEADQQSDVSPQGSPNGKVKAN